ncbi:nuclear transport factor 2 family protein [Prolixibacteraceae bacterium Z1-6]|uniref:Nuclear transport factor 2 family protein n=1 Tax=Draconibacterium aestuarii TaxID=2998507 RepID=A0A9X3J7L5_9BACT|nr:nuclear transport factor 2 family protein [Prolixibacteraceae bacterium Z1-6]
MSNLETLKKGYQFFAEGNLEEVIKMWNDDIVWEQCVGFPFVEGNGKFVGPQSIVENIFSHLPEYYDDFNIEINDFVDAGDKIVMVGHYTGVYRPTGKKFKANATHTWTFRDGKTASFFQAVDTAAIINP